ncbi:hypothetical protein R3P38DRAFT_3216978 [Favolaschia claudopus]|uniref:Testicular haploid expressed protein n=1 Tax=Favolaschia claudopus TaxID=2862362 RepID=A0AAW0A691_9AGAR
MSLPAASARVPFTASGSKFIEMLDDSSDSSVSSLEAPRAPVQLALQAAPKWSPLSHKKPARRALVGGVLHRFPYSNRPSLTQDIAAERASAILHPLPTRSTPASPTVEKRIPFAFRRKSYTSPSDQFERVHSPLC